MKNTTTNYLVGHYITFGPHREREFHTDFVHKELEPALKDWEYLCSELPKETDVEIRKQTTESVVKRIYNEN